MSSFEIIGGKRLKGEIIPQGAKNEALQVISAVLLTAEKVEMHKVPDIRDVNKLIEILRDLGVKVERTGAGSYILQADEIDLNGAAGSVGAAGSGESEQAARATARSPTNPNFHTVFTTLFLIE